MFFLFHRVSERLLHPCSGRYGLKELQSHLDSRQDPGRVPDQLSLQCPFLFLCLPQLLAGQAAPATYSAAPIDGRSDYWSTCSQHFWGQYLGQSLWSVTSPASGILLPTYPPRRVRLLMMGSTLTCGLFHTQCGQYYHAPRERLNNGKV